MAQAKMSEADILIVDDTPQNLRLLSKILIQEGYNVRQAINGKVALSAVQASLPDLILLDIMMPEMDGYEICQMLKASQQTAGVPIIFLSALDDGLDKVKAFALGGADYIAKPFQMEEVISRVRYQLALKLAHEQIHQLNTELEERVKERTHQLEVANVQLLRMATHDVLTGLPNRALFLERLEQALAYAKVNADYQFAVLFLDCDRFKIINDSLGHLVGDELLIAITSRLTSLLKPETIEFCNSCDLTAKPGDCDVKVSLNQSTLLARLGGDEFAVLLLNIQSIDEAAQVANQILGSLSHPFQLSRHEVFITASIGITLGNSTYTQPEHLLRDADTAMYQAKAMGKSQYQTFDPVMHEAANELLQLETDLRRAVQQQEFIVYYQPIIDLRTGKIVGFEALVRWWHPQQGLIAPNIFIPVAEETGIISQIGGIVLQEACHQLRLWQQHYPQPLSMSVNLSVRQFAQPNLIEQIDQILVDAQLNPACLKLEITESAIMDNPDSAAKTLQALRERQIQLSLDDFGTGYSSLSYLHLFPINILKIDRSFTQVINEESQNLGLVPAILAIAKTLNIQVVAEGISSQQQLDQLRALECDFGQGFLFSRPLSPEKIEILLKSDPQW